MMDWREALAVLRDPAGRPDEGIYLSLEHVDTWYCGFRVREEDAGEIVWVVLGVALDETGDEDLYACGDELAVAAAALLLLVEQVLAFRAADPTSA